jgi:hypothetical protein
LFCGSSCTDGVGLPGHALVDTQDVVGQPVHQIVQKVACALGTDAMGHDAEHLHFVQKSLVCRLVLHLVPGVQAAALHVHFFVAEVLLGVAQEGIACSFKLPGVDVLGGHAKLAQPVDQVNEFVVLVVHRGQAGDESVAPDKKG